MKSGKSTVRSVGMTTTRLYSLAGCLALSVWLCSLNAPAAVRLAIIPETGAVESVGDLLTATFSANNNIQLVERAELARVLREPALVGSKDFLKAGQILNADGVLLLNIANTDTNQILNLRLLAVKPGVIIRQISAIWPLPDLTTWASELGQRLNPWWPKLAVLQKDAVPVSILNLRSALRTAEAEGLERELTTLLYHRLSQQPEVFVLERRRLELLAEEKEISGSSSNFWNGGYLLDGLINKDSYDTSTVTLSGQVRAAGQTTGTKLEITGSRTNLPALIDELAQRILALTKTTGRLSEWDTSAEAQQYWEESQWAMKWRMWREAQAASEASWALGRQTKEVAELRVRAWQETGKDNAACTFELKQVLVNYSSPPDADRFADLRRAADLYETGWKRFVEGRSPMEARWFELGVQVVTDLSVWLRHYYFMPEARQGQELSIEEAQQQAARICRLLASHPDYPGHPQKALLAQARALWSSLWVQTPEAGLKQYHELQAASEWPLVRKRFLNSYCFAQEAEVQRVNAWPEGYYDPASPLLTGWKWPDRQRWPRVWEEFVEEWCNSTNSLVAAEGHYLRCCFAWFGEDYERELAGLLGVIWEHRESLARANLLAGWRADLQKLVGKGSPGTTVPNRLASLSRERRNRIERESWPEFERKLDGFIKSQGASKQRLQVMTDVRNYFATRKDFDFPSFARWQREKFSPVEAEELLPLVQAYKTRLSELPPGTLRGTLWANSITRLEASLQATITGVAVAIQLPRTNAIGISPPATNRRLVGGESSVGTRPSAAPGMPLPAQDSQRPPPVELNPAEATNFLGGVKFWRPDRKQFQAWEIADLMISDVIFREGKLWAEVLFQEIEQHTYHRERRAAVCAIDPVTLATEMFFVEQDQGMVPFPRFTRTGRRHFEIYRNTLYFNVGEKLRRYPLAQRRWEASLAPIDGWVQMDIVHDRLYLRTADSLLVMNEAGEGTEILASTRRLPAQNALDQVEQLGSAVILPGPNGTIRISVQGKLWTYSSDKKDWEVVKDVPASMRHREGVTATESNRLWSFVGSIAVGSDQGTAVLKETNGRQGLLFGFDDDQKKPPLTIPLRLEIPRDLASGQALNQLVSSGSFGETLFRANPAGLILTHHHLPGFWLLPQAELERRWQEWQQPTPR